MRQVSGFLYQRAHYVYNWGVGEAYFMELLAMAVTVKVTVKQTPGLISFFFFLII